MVEDLRRIPESFQFAVVVTVIICAIAASVVCINFVDNETSYHGPPMAVAYCGPKGVTKVIHSTDNDPFTIVCNNGNVYTP